MYIKHMAAALALTTSFSAAQAAFPPKGSPNAPQAPAVATQQQNSLLSPQKDEAALCAAVATTLPMIYPATKDKMNTLLSTAMADAINDDAKRNVAVIVIGDKTLAITKKSIELSKDEAATQKFVQELTNKAESCIAHYNIK